MVHHVPIADADVVILMVMDGAADLSRANDGVAARDCKQRNLARLHMGYLAQ